MNEAGLLLYYTTSWCGQGPFDSTSARLLFILTFIPLIYSWNSIIIIAIWIKRDLIGVIKKKSFS